MDEKAFYDSLYCKEIENNNIIFSQFSENIKFIETIGLAKKKDIILDTGCGTGFFLRHLYENGYSNLYGNEVSEVAIDYAIKKNARIDYSLIHGNKFKYPDNKFDIVLSFDVIEHIKDVESHFQEVKRVLKKGGYYILTTPNYYYDKLFFLFDKDHKKAHVSLQSKSSIINLIEKTGFSDIEFVDIRSELSEKRIKKIERHFILKYFKNAIKSIYSKGLIRVTLFCVIKS